jgi:hypothetical protein
MQPKVLVSIFLLLIWSFAGFCQDENPFNSIGKKGKVLTLSDGKYDELFKRDSVERVGSVLVNRYTRKIEKLLAENPAHANHSNAEQSRFLSVDPLAKKFPELSPYQYASNRPIDGKDLDGLEWQSTGKYFNSVTGKYEIDYKVTLSLNNDKNILSLTKDKAQLATYKNASEQAFSKLDAKGTSEDPIISTNVIFTDQKGPLNVQFYVNQPILGQKSPGQPNDDNAPAQGQTEEIGNSQVNLIKIPIAFQFSIKTDNGALIHAPVRALSSSLVARSLSHELGHTAGLYHVFPQSGTEPLNEQGPFDLSTFVQALLPEGNPKIVFDNLLNSPGNPIKSLNPDKEGLPQGTQLTTQQRQTIETTVQQQQPNSN